MHSAFNKNLLIFDLDDTLIDTSDVYWAAKSTFFKLVLDHSNSINEHYLNKLFEEIDSKNLIKLGYTPARYGKSMADTYQIMQERGLIKPSQKLQNDVYNAGKMLFTRIPNLIDGALEMLNWCNKKFTLSLITRGQTDLQLKKINTYSLQKYFQEIKIVERKTDLDFLSVIKSLNFDTKHTWIIGDSLKSEIETGLRIGANCIFFNYQHSSYNWVQERDYTIKSRQSYYKIDHLLEIPSLLTKLN